MPYNNVYRISPEKPRKYFQRFTIYLVFGPIAERIRSKENIRHPVAQKKIASLTGVSSQ